MDSGRAMAPKPLAASATSSDEIRGRPLSPRRIKPSSDVAPLATANVASRVSGQSPDEMAGRPLSPGRIKSVDQASPDGRAARPLSPGRIKSVDQVTYDLVSCGASTASDSQEWLAGSSSASTATSVDGAAGFVALTTKAKTLTLEEVQELTGKQVEAGKVVKTILPKSTASASGTGLSQNAARVIATSRVSQQDPVTSEAGRVEPPIVLSEVPLQPTRVTISGTGAVQQKSTSTTQPVGLLQDPTASPARRARSSTPPRRGRSMDDGNAYAQNVRQPQVTRMPARTYTVSSSSANDGLASTVHGASVTVRARADSWSSKSPGCQPSSIVRTSFIGSDAPLAPSLRNPSRVAHGAGSPSPSEVRHVECRVLFITQGRSWKFGLPAESSVNDAISQASQQVMRNVVESERKLSEKLAIEAVPSVTDTSTIAEWQHRNFDQSPLIVIKSCGAADDGASSQKPEMDALNIQKLMEEQTKVLLALQKQLNEQTSIIRNQSKFISTLQERERDQKETMAKAVERIESELAGIRGQLLDFEDKICKVSPDVGQGNNGRKAKPP